MLAGFVYSSCHVYCNKMRAFALYGIQPLNFVVVTSTYGTGPLIAAVVGWEE